MTSSIIKYLITVFIAVAFMNCQIEAKEHKTESSHSEKKCKCKDLEAKKVKTKELEVKDKAKFDGISTFNGPLYNLAPANITVDSTATSKTPGFGKTVFNTIQSAMNSLINKTTLEQPPTVVTILPKPDGSPYIENLLIQSVPNFVTLIGDSRSFVGVGIMQNSFWWNTANGRRDANGNFIPPNPVIGGGGSGFGAGVPTQVSRALISHVPGTNDTIEVINLNANTLPPPNTIANPNFIFDGVHGVVPGDKVYLSDGFIDHIYTVSSAPGAIGTTTLRFTEPILAGQNLNNLSTHLVILPNVSITTTTPGSVIASIDESELVLQGLTFLNNSTSTGVFLSDGSDIVFGNSAIVGGLNGIIMRQFTQMYTPVGPQAISIVGVTPAVLAQAGLAIFGLAYTNIEDAMITVLSNNVTPRSAISTRTSGYVAQIDSGNGNVFGTIDLYKVRFSNSSAQGAPLNLVCPVGTALSLTEGSYFLVFDGGLPGNFKISGPTQQSGPSIGIDCSAFSQIDANALVGGQFALSSGASSFIPIRIRQLSSALINLQSIQMFGSGLNIAQVIDGSTLTVLNFDNEGGSFILNGSGFLVDRNSSLIWNAGNVMGTDSAPTGSLFSIQNDSFLTIAPGISTFSNYPTIFDIGTNSKADITNATCTTLPGGINLNASDSAQVFLNNVTFNSVTENIGIKTASGAFVSGNNVVNHADIPSTPAEANQLKCTPSSAYTNSYDSGLVIVTPCP